MLKRKRVTLTIRALGSSGEGIATLEDGYVVFVAGALPGEVVDAELVSCHKNFARAVLISVLVPAEARVSPPCRLFGACGGCQLMHLAYSDQLAFKRQRVVDALERIAKVEGAQVAPCVASVQPLAYRNKIQVPIRAGFDGSLLFGLYKRDSHELVPVDHCSIHCDLGEKVFSTVRSALMASGLTAYDPLKGKGYLRHILIKSALRTGEVLVIFVTNGPSVKKLQRAAEELTGCTKAVCGVVHNHNDRSDNVIMGDKSTLLTGKGTIREELCGKSFTFNAMSFFQVNVYQAEELYQKVLHLAELTGQEIVLDAFCGVGTLSLLLADYSKEVLGIECVAGAVASAEENARLNGCKNAIFVQASAESYLHSIPKADVLILNPPRKGCEITLWPAIGKLLPKKIVYISCDPATLARDLTYLLPFGYILEKVIPFDMFPQTSHVETVALLKIRKNE